jgi:hypothetical protein
MPRVFLAEFPNVAALKHLALPSLFIITNRCNLAPSDESAMNSGCGSGAKSDLIVIVDVEGETVVINVATRVDEFDEFLPPAQKVLDSVEWLESE